MNLLKTLLLLVATMFSFTGGTPIAKIASISFENDMAIASMLKDGFSSILTVEENYYKNQAFDMCNGQLVLNCRVSSEFGWRVHPRFRHRHFHTGIDLATYTGAPIFAPADGIVLQAGFSGGYGRTIVLNHGYSWKTKYAHLNKLLVKVGQVVKKGEIIGEVGSTGSSTGPHLHFEMKYFDENMDPRTYFVALDAINSPSTAVANR